jgi:hypothetical protein
VIVADHRLRGGEADLPKADSPWERVALPHDWRLLPDNKRADAGWYRIRFKLDRAPAAGLALYLRNLRSDSLELFVNGARLAGSRELNPPRTGQDYNFPFYIFIPGAMLREGSNDLHIRMRGSSLPRNLHGLDRVHLGGAADVAATVRVDHELVSGSQRFAMAAAFTAGLIALLLWCARRTDKVMFWFAVACLSLAGVTTGGGRRHSGFTKLAACISASVCRYRC